MRGKVAVPFRLAPEDAVDARGWEWQSFVTEEWESLDHQIAGWDPARVTRLRRVLVVDTGGVREACGLDREDRILLAVSMASEDAYCRRCVFRSHPLNGQAEIVVEIELDGSIIAGEFELQTDLVLMEPSQSTDIFGPRVAGSCLWTESRAVEVEGSASQFPVEAGDFGKMPWIPGQDAPWHLELETDGDPTQPFLREVRLFINSAHPLMAEYQKHPQVVSMLQYDVTRLLLARVVPMSEFQQNAEHFERKTLGAMVFRLASTLFPGWSMAELASEIKAQPWQFETRLRAALGFLRE